ncbi:MAG: hypothetical protein ACXACU_10750 [Candidatus Hodarchaeales archaeon]|jgi:hypothetical protein
MTKIRNLKSNFLVHTTSKKGKGEKEKELAIKAQVQAYRTAMEPKRFIRPLIYTYLCKQLEE